MTPPGNDGDPPIVGQPTMLHLNHQSPLPVIRQKALRLPVQRLARPGDAPRLSQLMRDSILELFPRYYDARQTASAAVHVGHLDTVLIDDGTYYVHEAGGDIVACGGWSRRDRLYAGSGDHDGDARLLDPATEPARVRAMFVRGDWTRRGLGRAILAACERDARAEGFRTLSLMATLPGEPLYRAYGFRQTERTLVTMPDGVTMACVAMERPIASAPG
jgi:GNAT superfamily N-acetyltransferase